MSQLACRRVEPAFQARIKELPRSFGASAPEANLLPPISATETLFPIELLMYLAAAGCSPQASQLRNRFGLVSAEPLRCYYAVNFTVNETGRIANNLRLLKGLTIQKPIGLLHACFKACSRSAIKSPGSSTPTERRIVDGDTPSNFNCFALRPMCDDSIG